MVYALMTTSIAHFSYAFSSKEEKKANFFGLIIAFTTACITFLIEIAQDVQHLMRTLVNMQKTHKKNDLNKKMCCSSKSLTKMQLLVRICV